MPTNINPGISFIPSEVPGRNMRREQEFRRMVRGRFPSPMNDNNRLLDVLQADSKKTVGLLTRSVAVGSSQNKTLRELFDFQKASYRHPSPAILKEHKTSHEIANVIKGANLNMKNILSSLFDRGEHWRKDDIDYLDRDKLASLHRNVLLERIEKNLDPTGKGMGLIGTIIGGFKTAAKFAVAGFGFAITRIFAGIVSGATVGTAIAGVAAVSSLFKSITKFVAPIFGITSGKDTGKVVKSVSIISRAALALGGIFGIMKAFEAFKMPQEYMDINGQVTIQHKAAAAIATFFNTMTFGATDWLAKQFGQKGTADVVMKIFDSLGSVFEKGKSIVQEEILKFKESKDFKSYVESIGKRALAVGTTALVSVQSMLTPEATKQVVEKKTNLQRIEEILNVTADKVHSVTKTMTIGLLDLVGSLIGSVFGQDKSSRSLAGVVFTGAVNIIGSAIGGVISGVSEKVSSKSFWMGNAESRGLLVFLHDMSKTLIRKLITDPIKFTFIYIGNLIEKRILEIQAYGRGIGQEIEDAFQSIRSKIRLWFLEQIDSIGLSITQGLWSPFTKQIHEEKKKLAEIAKRSNSRVLEGLMGKKQSVESDLNSTTGIVSRNNNTIIGLEKRIKEKELQLQTEKNSANPSTYAMSKLELELGNLRDDLSLEILRRDSNTYEMKNLTKELKKLKDELEKLNKERSLMHKSSFMQVLNNPQIIRASMNNASATGGAGGTIASAKELMMKLAESIIDPFASVDANDMIKFAVTSLSTILNLSTEGSKQLFNAILGGGTPASEAQIATTGGTTKKGILKDKFKNVLPLIQGQINKATSTINGNDGIKVPFNQSNVRQTASTYQPIAGPRPNPAESVQKAPVASAPMIDSIPVMHQDLGLTLINSHLLT